MRIMIEAGQSHTCTSAHCQACHGVLHSESDVDVLECGADEVAALPSTQPLALTNGEAVDTPNAVPLAADE